MCIAGEGGIGNCEEGSPGCPTHGWWGADVCVGWSVGLGGADGGIFTKEGDFRGGEKTGFSKDYVTVE